MVSALTLFGVIAVAIATYAPGESSDVPLLNHIVNSSSAMRQSFYVLIAPVVVSVVMAIPYDFFKRKSQLLFLGINVLLVVTTVFNRATGVKAWLDVLWGYTIQPSEFAKIALILRMAQIFSKEEHPMHGFKDTAKILLYAAIPMAIILVSGEMGSMLVMAFLFVVMMFFAGVPWKTLGVLGTIAVLGIAAIYGFAVASGSDSYRLQRILAFFDPATYASTDAYQQMQSKICIGSGGMHGIGMFVDGAWSQLNYVPADWTDFIFATIGEAFGFVGCSALVAMYMLIVFRMLYLSRYTRDKFGRLVIIGVMAMLLFHVYENVAMTTGLMPITGIPLPFISFGGSNMVTNMGGVALVLNVTKNRSLSNSVITPQRYANLRRFRTGRW